MACDSLALIELVDFDLGSAVCQRLLVWLVSVCWISPLSYMMLMGPSVLDFDMLLWLMIRLPLLSLYILTRPVPCVCVLDLSSFLNDAVVLCHGHPGDCSI